jgi:hypothetical protein
MHAGSIGMDKVMRAYKGQYPMKPFINDNVAETYSQCHSLLQYVDVSNARDIITTDMTSSGRR